MSGRLTLRNQRHLRPILFTRLVVPVINTSNEVPKDIPPFVRSPEKTFGDVTHQPTQVVLTETEVQAAKSSQRISRTQDVAIFDGLFFIDSFIIDFDSSIMFPKVY